MFLVRVMLRRNGEASDFCSGNDSQVSNAEGKGVDCLCPGVTDSPVCTHNWGVIEEAGEQSVGKELAVQT